MDRMRRMTWVSAFLLALAPWLAPVGADAAASGSAAAEPARAVLYRNAPGGPGTATEGTVTWRLVGDGDRGPRVEAEIVLDGKRGAGIAFYPNADASLPASHLVELAFATSTNPVASVAGIVMKVSDTARGDPLAAVSVKVADGFFLIALAGGASDAALNLRLLGTRDWIDLPLVTEDGGRAVLAVEKGSAGRAVFARAIAAWSASADAPDGAGTVRP